LRAEAGEKIPNRLVPAAFIAVTVAAAVADVVLLAPMVDAMGIPDPTHQLFVAISFVAIGGMLIEGVRALLERAFNVQTEDVPAGKRRAAFRLAAAAAVLALAVTALFAIGLWRAEVLKHGGDENGWLADLLRDSGPLTSTMIVSFNIGLAVVTAFFSHWWERLVFAIAWHRAKSRLNSVPRRLAREKKRVEAILKRLESRLSAVAGKRNRCIQTYLQHYADGRQNGARPFPLLGLWLKAGVTLLFAFLLLVYATLPFEERLNGTVRWLTVVFGSVAVAGLVGYRTYLARLFPSPHQLAQQRAVHYGRQTVTEEHARAASLSLAAAPPRHGEKSSAPIVALNVNVNGTHVRTAPGSHVN
jgi:hypothetical protein